MKLLRKMIAGLAFLFLFAFCAYSQNAPLTRDVIIQMVKAGLPEDVIISKIRLNRISQTSAPMTSSRSRPLGLVMV